MGKTQTEMVLEYLMRFEYITALDAIRDFGCMRLASRISDLKKAGYSIRTTYISVPNRFGKQTKIARYSLE